MMESRINQTQFNNDLEEKNTVGRMIFSPRVEKPEEKTSEQPLEDDDMLINDFDSRSESSLNTNCNMVYVLPIEYD